MKTTLRNEDDLKNEDNLKSWWGVVDWVPKQCVQPLIPLKVANESLELQIGTIPGRVGLGRVRSDQSKSDYKAQPASKAGA